MGFLEKGFNTLNGVLTLNKLAYLASTDKYPSLSEEQEMDCVKAWQDGRDEDALTRLLIDKSRLIAMKSYPYMDVMGKVSSPEDIHADALYGAIKGIEDYPIGKTTDKLNTYVGKGATWNIQREFYNYMGTNAIDQNKGRKALQKAGTSAQRELTTKEELDILSDISLSLKENFHKRQTGSTIIASNLVNDADAEHPFSDDTPTHQYTPDGTMDWVIDSNAKDPYEEAKYHELAEATNSALDKLQERERRFLKIGFGIGLDLKLDDKVNKYNRHMTPKQIGNVYDITKERVRQIQARALSKLRHSTRSATLETFYDNN